MTPVSLRAIAGAKTESFAGENREGNTPDSVWTRPSLVKYIIDLIQLLVGFYRRFSNWQSGVRLLAARKKQRLPVV